MRNKRNKPKIKDFIFSHIKNNRREYIIISILFCIGFILGILFINNINNTQKEQISQYINNFVENIKNNYTVDQVELLKQSIIDNIIIALILWFAGMSVIGMPIVYGMIILRGFCFSYTICAIIATLGFQKGIILAIASTLLQALIFIPIIWSLAVSGMKLYQSIVKDRRKENIKVEICRHTAFSFILCIGLIVSSLVEVYISSNLVLLTKNLY